MKTGFWKLSTAGNTTLFLAASVDPGRALASVPADQAAFVDFPERRLVMGANELCVNACLAFGALLEATGYRSGEISILDQSVKVAVSGSMPFWQVTACFPMPSVLWEDCDAAKICHLDGISHALINVETLPERDMAFSQAQKLRKSLGLESRPAAGIIWWRRLPDCLELMPIVSVPMLATCNLEGACGSASLALALAQGNEHCKIAQPSGKFLQLHIQDDTIEVSADVSFLADGHIWS